MSGARGGAVARGLLAFGFAAASAFVALFPGQANLSPAEVLAALGGGEVDAAVREVVRLDRVPRVALGLCVGASLAVAGALFQALLRNPLADPYLVGVGPGALLGAAVGSALGWGGASALGLSGAALCAFVGALAAAALVLAVAGTGGRSASARLVLAGVAVGSFVSAVATWLLYVESENWQRAIRWLLGSLAYADGPRVRAAAVASVGLAGLAWWWARDLDALALGEDAARLGGVDTARVLRRLAATGCLLTAVAVATAGLVGFVGLVVPHLARRVAGPRHRGMIPVAAGLGAGLLVLADAAARVGARVEVPVGVVTALLGAPVFAWIVRRAPSA